MWIEWRCRGIRRLVTVRHRVRSVLLCLVLWPLAGCGGHFGEAVDLLADIRAGHGASDLKDRTPPPDRTAISFEAGDDTRDADLWTPGPGQQARAAVVLVPGAAPRGRDDPRLTAFAASLARSGFRVLVPEIPNLREMRVGSGDAGIIADAIRYSAASPMPGPDGIAVAPGTTALVAISYAVGPAILAMRREGAEGRVGLLLAIGGYRDIANVVSYFTTGVYADRGRWRRGQPDPRGTWIFVEANAERVGDPDDAALLARIAARRRRDKDAPIGALAERLGPAGRSVLDLAMNRNPQRVRALIERLPDGVRRELAAIDLADRDLSGMGARAVFIHGSRDPVIPAAESRALASAWPTGKSRLLLLDGIAHVDAGGLGLADGLSLVGEVARMLELRDRWYEEWSGVDAGR